MSNKVGFFGGLAIGSFDADDGFPTVDLSDGAGAAVSHAGHARIRFNLSTQQIEQSINTGAWVAFATSSSSGSALAKYIIQTADASVPNAQVLSTLGTGIVKNTTGTGALSIAIANTDYPAVSAQYIVATATAAPPQAQNLGALTSGILQQTVSGGVSTLSIKNSTALSVLGRAINSTGIPDDIQATSSGQFLRRDGNNTLGFGAITTADIGGILSSIRVPKLNEYWVYLLDYDGTGNDTTGSPGIASSMSFALSQAIPIKTFEKLGQILPRAGNGATLVVLIKPRASGANYRNIANTADADGSFLNSLSGWHVLIRGSLDFANDTNDKIRSGFLTYTGTNSAGYNATAASTADGTTLTCQLAGGGAPALPAEGFSGITGLRIRFLSTTSTTALQNVCVGIIKNTSTTIRTMDVLSPLPSASDVFVIETPGVGLGNLTFTAGYNRTFSMVGLAASTASTMIVKSSNHRITGCLYSATATFNDGDIYSIGNNYLDEADAVITIGIGIRVATSITFNTTKSIALSRSAWLGTSTVLSVNPSVLSFGIGAGCVSIQGVVAIETHGPNNATWGTFGSTTIARPRIYGPNIVGSAGIHFGGTGARIFGTDFSNCTTGMVKLNNTNSGVGKYYIDDLVSPDGNNTNLPTDTTCFVLSITETKQSDGMSVFCGTNAGGAITATADRDIICDGGLCARFIDLLRQNLAFMGIHIYGGNPASGVWNPDQIHGPTAIIETAGNAASNAAGIAFFGNGPYPPFRVQTQVGNLGPNGPNECVMAYAANETVCRSILGVSSNYVYSHGDATCLIQAGPCKIEFVAGQLSANVPDGMWAYLSELDGANTGKARIGPPSSGVTVPLGPIHTVDYDNYLFAQVNLISHGRTYLPREGHVSTSVVGNPLATFSGLQDIQATASGQFLRRDGSSTLGFGPITTSDLPGSVTSVSGVVITAGAGLTGGGNLTANRIIDVVAADGTIIVNPDSIQVGVITTANITNNAVDNTKIRDSVGTSVIGRSTGTTGDPADIVASASGQFLRRDGSGTLGFGAILLSDLPAGIAPTPGGDVFSTRQIIAGSGLAGGGDLSADRTFNVGAADTTIVVNPDTIQVGTINTANINNNQVTDTKLRTSTATSVVGRSVNSTGNVADISATASGQFLRRDGSSVLGFGAITTSDLPLSVTSVSGVNIIAGSGLAGGGNLTADRTINIGTADATITVNADTIQVGVITTANITNNAVDNTKIRDSVATSVIGRSANSTGDPADIQSTTSGQFLRRDSTSLGFGTIGLTDLPSSVTSVSGVVLTAGAGLTGGGALTANRTFDVAAADATITVNPDSIQVGVIQNANIRTSAATSVIGRSANSIGQVADITALASGHFLRRDGSGVLGFGTIVLSDLPPGITGGGGGGGDVFSTRQVIAGAGLTGGGNLTADRTFDVVAADGTIVVAADSVKVGIITNTNINDATINVDKLVALFGSSLLGRDNVNSGAVKELEVRDPLFLLSGDAELSMRANAFSVIGSPSTTGPASNITATASGQFVNMNGSLAFRNIVTSDFPIAPDSTLLGNFSGSNVAPVYLHINQIRDLLSIGVGPFQFAYSAGFSSGSAPIDGIWISSSDGTASFARNQHFGWCAPGALGGTVYSKLRMTVNVLGFLAGGGRSVDVNATVNGTIVATMGSYNTTIHDSFSFNNIFITEGDEIGVKLTGTMNNFDVINIYVAIFIQ